MVTLKNIFQTTMLITYLLKRVDGVGSSDENTQIPDLNEISMDMKNEQERENFVDGDGSSNENIRLPDLNDISMDMRDEQDKCVDNIYTQLKCPRPTKHREDIPKKVFGTIDVDDLTSNDAERFFMYLHDKVIPITRCTRPYNMMNPIDFCKTTVLPIVHYKLRDKNCIERLTEFYKIDTINTLVIRDAFKHIIEDKFYRTRDYAHLYYKHLAHFLGFIGGNNAVMTPVEFCGGLTEPRKRVLDFGSSSKAKKSAGSSTSKNSSSSKQEA